MEEMPFSEHPGRTSRHGALKAKRISPMHGALPAFEHMTPLRTMSSMQQSGGPRAE